MPSVLALFGPTGVGKTAVAVAVAERLRARGEDPVAIGADAMQVYAGLEILTGAASPAERERLEHRLVGVLAVDDPCSAGRYATMAHAEIDAALAAGRTPLVLGGTGLYLRAALADLELRPPADPARRAARTEDLRRRGPAALHEELTAKDPAAAARTPVTDPHRLVRALELLDGGHVPPPGAESSRLWTTDTRLPTRLVALTMDRDELYARIEDRVDAMVLAGAQAEVHAAEAAGAAETVRKAVGYRELLAGDVDAMKRASRQYARRQLTWLRKLDGAERIDVTGRTPEDVAAEIVPDGT